MLLFSTAMALAGGAQTSEQPTSRVEETWSAACSSKIEHPLYPSAAIDSRLTGSVSAAFAIDAAGKAMTLTLSGPPLLAETVRTAIDRTTFPTLCAGRRLKVTFSFQVKPVLPDEHYVSVCFSHPPNVFSVIADTIKMVCSHYAYVSPLVGPGGMKPITICELLADAMAYDGKQVALLGRLEESHEGTWLSEDGCGLELITDGYVWANRVWVANRDSAPSPPQGILVLDPGALDAKLESVRRTTSLEMEEVLFFTKDGAWGTRLEKQHWAVIFGRIEARNQLRRPRNTYPNRDWGNGFGHLNIAPVQIISKQEDAFYIWDTVP